MKKIILSLIIFSSSLTVFSQISKGTIAVSINGNYYDGSSSNGVTTNSLTTIGQNLNAGLSIEYYVTNNVFFGVGFDYYWGKEVIINQISNNAFKQLESMRVKSNLKSPNFFGGYNWRVSNKLYLIMNLKLGFGRYSNNSYSAFAWRPKIVNEDGTLTQVEFSETSAWEFDDEYSYFGSSLSPEINYFFSDKFGLCLGLGGIEYAVFDWNIDQSSWNVNFNPNYWKLGIKFKI